MNTPALDAIETVARAREALESECKLDRRAFWRLCKELGAPRWKTEVLIQFDGEPPRRVLVTREGAL